MGRRAASLAGVVAIALSACTPPRLATAPYRAPPPSRDAATGFDAIARALAVLRAHAPPASRGLPPFVLTASRGALAITELRVRGAIDGPIAVTELELGFAPSDHGQLGMLALALPAGARIRDLAVSTPDGWRDAVIEKHRGTSRPALHPPVEPGGLVLDTQVELEPGPGLRVRASYTQEVGATRPYRLALAGLPAIDAVDVEITGGAAPVAIRGTLAAPADIEVAATGADAVVAGDAVVVRLPAEVAGPAEPVTELAILVDTSASRAAVLRDQARAIRDLVTELERRGLARVEVAAYDHAVAPLFAGSPAEVARAIEDALVARGAFGASDLGPALAWASDRGLRALVVGDGVQTLGASAPKAIAKRVRGLSRVDALVLGGPGDPAVLAAIAARGRRAGAILSDRDAGPGAWADRLERAAIADAPIAIDGAAWVWPERAGALQTGDDVVIRARLLPGARTDQLTVRLGAQATEVPARASTGALVERAVAAADIARRARELDASGADRAQQSAVYQELTELAARNGLVTGSTSLAIDTVTVAIAGGEPRVRDINPSTGFFLDTPPPTDDGLVLATGLPSVGVTFDKPNPDAIPIVLERGASELVQTGEYDGVRKGHPEINGPQDGTDFRGPRLPLGWDESHHVHDRWVPRPPEVPDGGRPAWTGRFADTIGAISEGQVDRAIALAIAWQAESPGDPIALVALGEALEARGSGALAARAYGSILDRFADRADFARLAGERLERAGATDLAIAAYRRAVELDPSAAAGHRLLAWALAGTGDLDGALVAIETGYSAAQHTSWPAAQVFRHDFAMLAAAIATRSPERRAELEQRGVAVTTLVEQPATVRFVLQWEDSANVDLHLIDRRSNRAWYERPQLGFIGAMFGAYGAQPEEFILPLADAHQAPYRLAAWVADTARPVAGTLQIIEYDGRGGFVIEHRPFVVTEPYAYVDLGTWE
jgi:hypothetical protein